jgi:hypothetical protein
LAREEINRLQGERDAGVQQKNNVSRELVNFKNESQKQTSKIQEQSNIARIERKRNLNSKRNHFRL